MVNILLVEDQKDLREEVHDVLQYEGFNVYALATTAAAKTCLKEHRIDLILCTMMMPDDSGMNLLKAVRAQHQLDDIPFLFLTGRVQVDILREAMDAGADDYILKPVRSSDLIRAIRARLRRTAKIKEVGMQQFTKTRDALLHYFPHEIYTPLNVSMGISKLIKKNRHNISPQELKKWTDLITANNTRLYHLMENQLMYLETNLTDTSTHVTRNRLELAPEIELLAQERAEHYKRAGDLQLSIEPTDYPIRSKHFQIIVRALVDNAFKFSASGTPVMVNLKTQNNRIYFDVTDSGTGMSAQQIENINAFQQFKRKQNEQQGLGLGLELCRRLLKIVNGSLKIESVEGRYTHVQVTLK